ncbi:hypothetical protein TrRE_jg5448 [Triparma retinervis]|uniref:Uncharacterized protein n=1 Tax=Triparma retinervis TaxID=2557542 RepID=A0A9W7FWD2_9STRA|nr:hypothetical protein TrRE_jg5448 [Triparma retinervis]
MASSHGPIRESSIRDFEFLRSESTTIDAALDELDDEEDDFYHEVHEDDSVDSDIDVFGRSSDVSAGSSGDWSMPPPPPSLASSSVSEASSMTQTNPKKTIANSISGLSIRSKAKKALGLGGKEDDGLILHAQIVSDDYKDAKNCHSNGLLKNRRPMPIARASDFFNSLEYTGGKWIHRGPLNGWPGLRDMEVVSVTGKVKVMVSRTFKVKRYWSEDTHKGTRPGLPSGIKSVRVTLQLPKYTARGWTPESPGYVWWFDSLNEKVGHGTDIAKWFEENEKTEGPCVAKKIHHFAHRYARKKESTKDKLTYHGAIMIEWNHGKYCSVLELAYHNGVGGWGGRCNWHEDSLNTDPGPKLLQCLPVYMIAPYKTYRAELRCHDIPAKNLKEFLQYVERHEDGKGGEGDKRFLDFHLIESEDATFVYKRKADIATIICNYIRSNNEYHEESRNCQTFAADTFRMLTGKHTKPYHTVCQLLYAFHPEWFLYEPND